MNKKINKKGFTLIEVVLTIAIGALIFLLAFLAFGNARVNQRDSQRRADLDKIAGEISNFAGDNAGTLPSDTAALLSTYYSSATDPLLKTVTYSAILNAPYNTDTPGRVLYTKVLSDTPGCDTSKTIKTGGYKVTMKLEKGLACRDSL